MHHVYIYPYYVCDFRLEEDYTEAGVLGSGGYGIVFHVQRATDKHDFALKLIVSNM